MANKVTQAESTDPVKRTKRTSASEKTFLKTISIGGSITDALKSSGLGKSTVYEWNKDHPDFADEWKKARQSRAPVLEEMAYDISINGVVETKVERVHTVIKQKSGEGDDEEEIEVPAVVVKETEVRKIPTGVLMRMMQADDARFRPNPPEAPKTGDSLDNLIIEAGKIKTIEKQKKK